MTANRYSRKIVPLGIAGALAALAVAGAGLSSTATAKPSADKTAQAAQSALAKGQIDKAIQLTEALVAGSPREPAYRSLLGNAYLKAGRFESAVTAFNDAMTLGDNSSRTALGLALSNVAAGKPRDAVAILDDWRDAIPAADLGLALALAGESSRGVAILSDALRAGDPTPKVRQNLAYAYALDGRWRDARVMAAMDVPADQIDARLSSWAEKAKPEDSRLRIAGLLNAPVRSDAGQPAQLALNASPDTQQLAAEKSGESLAMAAPAPAAAELPAAQPATPEAAAALANYAPVDAAPVPAPVQVAAPQPQPAPVFAAAFPASAPAPAKVRVKAPAPVKVAAAKPRTAARPLAAAPRPAAPRAVYQPAPAGGDHAVQLGSFASPQGARRAWGIFAAKNPELRKFKMTITPAKVHGRNFWRVAAAGFDGRSASGMCSAVKQRGGVCFAYTSQRTVVPGKPATAPMMARVTAKPVIKAPAKPAAKAPAGPGLARRH